ncbi:type I DNA topoisomerase [Mycoplasmopsis mucosicanis]|uniref:DNA topoisomerase 1 n=1 Tax=Mycoplasmopsis mucosicanis TaxID=458208 RepID=A0A507SQW1_9BACT|nr:type I DNA topoisomerase [Mycoplasmopsis mucosicanis]TQC54169.1 type I DNA topoisomerase [Mycoplasmopsis mucosicanis]
MSKLVIVESPNKVETIQKYLGSDYEVMASVGHIMKLSTKTIKGSPIKGVDIAQWEPVYILDSNKNNKATVKKLSNAAKKAEHIYIATDPDREGEAIGEHLVKYLNCLNRYSRIKYNEITKDAILNSIANPLKLDQSLIDAQKARRMLDRIIGFSLSNLLKQKIRNAPTNLSAGRVQSIALKLIVDREREIEAFVPVLYHKAYAQINENIKADYFNDANKSGEKDWIYPEQKAQIEEQMFSLPKSVIVESIKQSKKSIAAITPLKQATLYKKSPFNSSSTQRAAQNLYEGYGDGGLISYPRTDSTRLSQNFIDNARVYIREKFGDEYVAKNIKGFSGDQDAHEAIRPTDITLTPEKAKEKFSLDNYDYQIYKLIYEHTLQALITPPQRMSKTYIFAKENLKFKFIASKILFDGYYVVKGDKEENIDPNFIANQVIDVQEFKITDHQTNPPARYSEGSLIEALDEIKVGRPSTFASTVHIVLDRQYAKNINGALRPTPIGCTVVDKLVKSFPTIIEENYTARVEDALDKIASNEKPYRPVMQDFWDRYSKVFEEAKEKMILTEMPIPYLEEPCELCKSKLVVRVNKKKGTEFAGCSNFPNCRFTKSL